VSDRSKYRGPDITLGRGKALGHGECQGCGHKVWYNDFLPEEEYSNCCLCNGFMIVTRFAQFTVDEDDD
jgi:hypothetical protein